MRATVVCTFVMLGLTRTAVAEPVMRVDLGGGLALAIDGGHLVVRRGKTSAYLGEAVSIASVKRDAKTRSIAVVTNGADELCVAPTDLGMWTLDELTARVEDAEARAFAAKHDFAHAAAAYARALALAPGWSDAAYDLAATSFAHNDPDAAAAALAPWRAALPIETYLHVALDPTLAPLLARPEFRAIAATTPGTARVTPDLAPRVPVLYSAERGLLAVHTTETAFMECGYAEAYEVYVLATGMLAWRIPVLDHDDFARCPESGDPTVRVLRAAAKPAITARVAQAQAQLVALGFSPFAPTAIEVSPAGTSDDGDKWKAYLEKSKLGVVVHDKAVHILRGNATLGGAGNVYARLGVSYYLVDLHTMVVNTYEPGSETCGIDPYTSVSVIKLK